MRSEATREGETIVGGQVLYMALELSDRTWKVLFASPAAGAQRAGARSRAADGGDRGGEAPAGAVGASACCELLRGGP
jgi:hypothetical protein